MADIKERRQWERRSLDATILFRAAEGPGGRKFRSGKMRDISDGGVSFDTDDPPAEGALIDMFFKEHNNAADQRVRGRVVWKLAGHAGRYTIGVSFANCLPGTQGGTSYRAR